MYSKIKKHKILIEYEFKIVFCILVFFKFILKYSLSIILKKNKIIILLFNDINK